MGEQDDPAEVSPDEAEVSPEPDAQSASTSRSRLWVAIGAVAVVALVAVGIVVVSSNAEPESPAAPPRSTTRSPAPSTPPVPPSVEPLAAKPLWTSRGFGEATSADVREGVAIYTGRGRGLALVDAASGAMRWSVTGEADLPGGDGAQLFAFFARPRLVGHGNGLAVLTEYYWSNCPRESCIGGEWKNETGLALLSAANGRVVWRVPTLGPEVYKPGEARYWLEYLDDRTALVSVAPGDRTALEDLRAMAIDVPTGKVRWERTGFWPRAVVGDTVIGETTEVHPDTRQPDDKPDGGVAGFDLATGAPRWDRDAAQLVVTGRDVALVRTARGRDVEGVIVEGATGREVTKFGGTAESCAGDQTMLACQLDREGLDEVATFRLEDREVDVSAAGLTSFGVDMVWRDRIFVSNDHERYTITRAGNRVDRRLPGELVAITDDYALFRVSRGGPATIQCFRLA